jgi:hypothetical protein
MSKKDKINWIICPDCGSKIGIILSVGKVMPSTGNEVFLESSKTFGLEGITKKLVEAGVDIDLVNVNEEGNIVAINPKKFLGDLWGPINDSIKSLGGTWIRDGRNSRWELVLEDEDV